MTSCMVHRGNVIPVKTEIKISTGLIVENCVYFYILALDQYYDLRRFDPAIKSFFFKVLLLNLHAHAHTA